MTTLKILLHGNSLNRECEEGDENSVKAACRDCIGEMIANSDSILGEVVVQDESGQCYQAVFDVVLNPIETSHAVSLGAEIPEEGSR